MLFATQNPAGLYGGRKTLSRAFRNRFLELHFDDIPVNELQEILHKRTQLPESRCKRIVTVYRELSLLRQENRLFEQKSFATLRDLFRWALRPNDTIEQLAANGYMLLAERVRKAEERDAIKAIIEGAMSQPKVSIDESALYGSNAPEIAVYTQQAQHHGVVWTKAMRRLYTLVARAIQNDEPVLLIGETGCGKTTVCQMLADALRQPLATVNAHQNTETGDLIGSQRPVRNHAANEAHLRQLLLASEALRSMDMAAAQSTDDLLVLYDNALATHASEARETYHNSQAHLDIQLTRTRYKALFEWVDGTLVGAMRNGSCFLLDEISLADDSVLERINSVLESSRSILLAEKGVTDSFITAKPGFQFFATMNPGGDYGKRELSPALRNRFTEIWVPALSDLDDVVQIVQAKLTPPMRMYADAMVGFARWFNQRYNTSTTSAVSIRDVLAWTSFVNVAAATDAGAAVMNGAAMVYIDTLGANPAGLMTAVSSDLNAERRDCIGMLGDLLHDPQAAAKYYAPVGVSINQSQATFGVFALPRAGGSTTVLSDFSFDTPTAKVNAMRVVRAMQLTKPILLEGSPGVGKTALVTAIASTAGVPLTRLNLSEQTDLMDLFGSDVPVQDSEVGTFVWQDAPFLRAMKNGEWVLLDEMNLASQSVLEGLNACLDHRGEVFIPEIGQTFTRHNGFRLFAAQNPHHQGGGRKGLPASFVNRFTVVYADALKSEDLMLICRRSYLGLDESVIVRAVDFVSRLNAEVTQQKRFGSQGGPWEFNLRDITRWLSLVGQTIGLLAAGNARDFVEMLFGQRFRNLGDRAQMNELFRRVYGDDLPRADLVSSVSPSTLQLGLGSLPRHTLYALPSNGMRSDQVVSNQLYSLQSLMVAVHQAWPVILSGSSGVGKTAMLEGLASSVGASLETFTLNAETDAMDLIGGYEQADSQRETSSLLEAFSRTLQNRVKTSLTAGTDSQDITLASELRRAINDASHMPMFLQHLAQCDIPGAQSLAEKIRASAVNIDKARFVWIDGFLVNAMLHGRWLVLDNANLCSLSVLDRLNSLLEPNGVLIMSEHVGEDGAPRVIRPHADFRIFLTVDPRYGDLSRAMRNRALEIHLLEASAEQPLLAPLSTESAIARFRHVQTTRPAEDYGSGSLELSLAQLAICDQPQRATFARQASAGLIPGAPLETQQLVPRRKSSRSVGQTNGLDQLEAFYLSAISQKQMPADFARVQSIHPLTNQPLVQGDVNTYLTALCMGFSYELRTDLEALRKVFEAYQADRNMIAVLTRAEKQQRIAGITGASNVLRTLLGFVGQVHAACQDIRLDEPQLVRSRRFWQYMIAALWRICELCGTQAFHPAVLSACLSICYKSLALAPDLCLTNFGLGTTEQAFSAIVPRHTSLVGAECVTIWEALRSTTPVTEAHLHSLVRLEDLIKQIDTHALRFQQSVDAIVALRQSCSRALNGARMPGADVDTLMTRLSTFAGLKDDVEGAELSGPCLVSVFDALSRQFSALSVGGLTLDGAEAAIVDALALRPVALASVEAESASLGQRALARLPAVVHCSRALRADTGSRSLADTALHGLRSINKVPLEQLQLLQSEVQVLGRVAAAQAHLLLADQQPKLDSGLSDIVHAVLSALQRSDRADVRSIAIELNAAADGSDTNTNAHQGYGDSLWTLHMSQVVEYLVSQHSAVDTRRETSAGAWRAIALACFYLYLPDVSFDPALEPLEKHAVHTRNERDLGRRIEALRTFGHKLTGVESSLHVRLLDSDLRAIGPAPELPPVFRPASSELASLQMEFDGLWRVVKTIESSRTSSLDSGTRANLTQIRRRLADQYRAYDDFTTPVLGFIDCLFVGDYLTGQGLIDLVSSSHVQIGELVPFAASSLKTWQSDGGLVEAQSICTTTDERILWLAAIGARSASWPLAGASIALVHGVETQFAQLYDQWRTELNQDQRDDVAKSSLYRYVDNAELQEDPTDDQLDEFLQGARDMDVRNTNDRRPPAIRKQAGTIVAVHRALCIGQKSASDNILGLLRQYAQAMPHDSSGHRLITSLPMLMLRLQDAAVSCQQHSASDKAYNMYADANMVEVQRLEKLIRVIHARFRTLRTAWPDHATPVDVLVLCDQVLSRSHSDPLPDFIPLLEKLHATINEWQKIASREHSAAAQYESITDLIIDWRRLELSSWAGMFGQEIRRSKDEAAAWWFVAYETIIAATETLPEDAPFGMLGALESFMHTSGLGEYQVRLDLLRDFEAHAFLRARRSSAFHRVHEGLANVVSYFSHFEDAVQQALVTGRATLEKSLKEMIKIASWKDRNIATLRQSAKASHRKLFRLVCKFRVLLAQPVTNILQAGVPEVKDNTEHPILESSVEVAALIATEDSELSSSISQWASRAPRFRNVNTTISLMQSKTLAQADLDRSAQRLDTFLDDLGTTIKALQQETPPTLTAENKVVVNHLKTRKRRLLADVLKNVRSMGLQHNLGEDLLSKQSSFPNVMAQLHTTVNSKETLRAMYKFLGIMQPVREAARKHSEDLTPAETARCVAYLESLLSVTIGQHNTLAGKRAVSQALASQLETLRGFSQCTRPVSAEPMQNEWDVQSLTCAAQVLSAAAKLAEIQAQLSGKDLQHLVMYLTEKASAVQSYVQQWQGAAFLPAGIVDERDAARSSVVSGVLRDVLGHMVNIADHNPELGYLTEHLKRWLFQPGAGSGEYTNGVHHHDQDTWLQELLSCLDTVLAAVQRVEGVFDAGTTDENEAAWLLKHQRLHESAWDALAYAEVSQKMASLVTTLQHVSSGKGHELGALALACRALYPILNTYAGIGERILSTLSSLHTQSARLGHVLARSFITLAKDGFCSPPEKSQDGKQEAGDVETGTGLGDGEGGEDISKDVGADEDLSELAQEKNKADKDGDVEDEKDAVDMADQEMEGELGDVEGETSDGDEVDDDDGEKDLDEEAGSVGDLDDGAVDEKMWDEGRAEQENSKEANSGETTAKDQDLSAATEDSREEAKDGDDGEEGEEEEDTVDTGTEDVTRQETEAVDPHMPEQDNLDLPDDIDMEDASDSDGMSDVDSIRDDVLPGAHGEETSEVPDSDNQAEPDPIENGSDPEDETEHTGEAGDEAEGDVDADEDDENMLRANNEQQDQRADGEVAGEQGTGMETDPSQAQTEGGASEQDQQLDADTSASTQQASGAQSGAEADKQAADSSQAAPISAMDKQKAQYQELGNVLDEWYKQQRGIQAPNPEADRSKEEQDVQADVDMADATFEHLPNEAADADTQALGTASADQSGALNEETSRAVNEQENEDDIPFQDMPDDSEHEIEDMEGDPDAKTEASGQVNESRNAKAMVGDKGAYEDAEMDESATESEVEDVDDVDDQLLHTHISSEDAVATMSLEEARTAWAEHESSTRNLALILTEHLRLILHPTQATKMRGDFRTGKRLNIKRIIPYIASSYKRDKIWMRRSIPSKRSYQIMLAIDDSKSMDESDSKPLAFETLALVAKSMSMLEVGEICVLGFGEEVKLAHDFSTPFTSEAGAEVFQSFTFAQSKTNVRKMLAESIELFRAARLKATGSSSELWQLQLIISDGVCEDHPSIRQLVRQAFEERIMVVFIIVDALSRKASASTQATAVPNQSILDLQTAEFTKNAGGEMQLKMVKYLDTFPFQYYLIVRDVQELPGVLAGALRQWFAEVVESGGR
ncbi:AAA ATPase midasin [Oleoguttula sp. CCFEE 5521]